MNDHTAILLINTGSPKEPTPQAVREYLAEFLNDPRIIDLPGWQRSLILKFFILPRRPARSAEKYKTIWTSQGSPLLVYGEKIRTALEINLRSVFGESITVVQAMRYGEPNIPTQLHKLDQNGIKNIIVLPLFPQFSSTTTQSIIDVIDQIQVRTTIIAQYFDHPAYIHALSTQIQTFWKTHGQAEKLLFSFHGIPCKWIKHGDPYQEQCFLTVKKLIKTLGCSQEAYAISFQSRFGKGNWLKPDTRETLLQWAKQGIRDVQVFTPGFAVDCLETLHEIKIELNEEFKQISGRDLVYIPALNDSTAHLQALKEILSPAIKPW